MSLNDYLHYLELNIGGGHGSRWIADELCSKLTTRLALSPLQPDWARFPVGTEYYRKYIDRAGRIS